jgi:hypothetical protein
VRKFGGYADILIFDVCYRDGRIRLDFERAIHIDLAAAVKAGTVSTARGFLQGLLDATAAVRSNARETGGAVAISDRLGLAVARKSFLDFVLQSWRKAIGARQLLPLCVQNIGPVVDLAELRR